MMEDRTLTVEIQANREEAELQLVSQHEGVPKKDRKKGKGAQGDSIQGKDTFKKLWPVP